jgi:hypothetical protein
MRGFLQPAKKISPNEVQAKFQTMARARRTKLAKTAQTDLIKADQWARGEFVEPGISAALAKATESVKKK